MQEPFLNGIITSNLAKLAFSSSCPALTHLHLAHRAVAHAIALRVGQVAVGGARRRRRPVDDEAAVGGGAGPAARVPDRVALQVHLFAVAERVAALGAAGARRMEVVVAAGLQHLAADVSIAVGTFDTVRLLVALFAIRHSVLADVLGVQNDRAVFAPVRRDNKTLF